MLLIWAEVRAHLHGIQLAATPARLRVEGGAVRVRAQASGILRQLQTKPGLARALEVIAESYPQRRFYAIRTRGRKAVIWFFVSGFLLTSRRARYN